VSRSLISTHELSQKLAIPWREYLAPIIIPLPNDALNLLFALKSLRRENASRSAVEFLSESKATSTLSKFPKPVTEFTTRLPREEETVQSFTGCLPCLACLAPPLPLFLTVSFVPISRSPGRGESYHHFLKLIAFSFALDIAIRFSERARARARARCMPDRGDDSTILQR